VRFSPTPIKQPGWMQGGGTISVPLPPHKFSSHDVVDIRPTKAASGGPALASGVVFRVKDEQIVVAVEEPPEEGMDQPLRLEKLANEVTLLVSAAAFASCLV